MLRATHFPLSAMRDGSTLESRIHDVLRNAAADIFAKELSVDVFVDEGAEYRRCSELLAGSIRDLIQMAIHRSPMRGDISVHALISERGLEIEVADTGEDCGFSHPIRPAFASQRLEHMPLGAPGISNPRIPSHLDLTCTRCPQGGLAWTLLVREPLKARKVA